MRYIIAGLLSALLIGLKITTPAHFNNSTVRAEAQTATSKVDEKPPIQQQPSPETVKPVEPEAPKAQETAEVQNVLTDKEQLMQLAGIPESDWQAVDYIVSHESSWNSSATNAESGAYGLCQALPANKMASAGQDWKDNPVTQLKWCHDYSTKRYGGWWGSFAFWQSNRWW